MNSSSSGRANAPAALLEVRDLSVSIRDSEQKDNAGRPLEREMVSKLSFSLAAGETLGLVGESGCGKSLTAMSLVDLLPRPQVHRSGGEIWVDGVNVAALDRKELASLRGSGIGVIFQDPMTALNPVQRAGQQIGEVLQLHFQSMNRQKRRDRCIALMRDVGIPAAEQRIDAYPHQLSGGMRQRLMIAMALAGEPRLLIADEPTTALDVTIQAQIISLLKSLQQKTGMAMLFITHDLGLVSQVSDRIAVMYAGKLVELRPAAELFRAPRHPYSKALLAALPGRNRVPKSPLNALPGQVPSYEQLPTGCRFASRCNYVRDACNTQLPVMDDIGRLDHTLHGQVACLRWTELPEVEG